MPIELTKDELTKINHALATIKEAKGEVIKAKQAGIPIENQERQLLEQESRLLGIKRVYGQARTR